VGVVMTNDCAFDVEPKRAVPTAVMDILHTYESEGGPFFFILQCLSGWKVVD